MNIEKLLKLQYCNAKKIQELKEYLYLFDSINEHNLSDFIFQQLAHTANNSSFGSVIFYKRNYENR